MIFVIASLMVIVVISDVVLVVPIMEEPILIYLWYYIEWYDIIYYRTPSVIISETKLESLASTAISSVIKVMKMMRRH